MSKRTRKGKRKNRGRSRRERTARNLRAERQRAKRKQAPPPLLVEALPAAPSGPAAPAAPAAPVEAAPPAAGVQSWPTALKVAVVGGLLALVGTVIKSTLGLVPAFLDRQAKSEAVARGEQQELRELASRLQRIDEVDDVALGRLRELAGAHPQSRAEATGRLAGFARRVSDRAAALAPDDADLERLHDLVEAAVKCASELRRDELGFDFEQRRLRLVVPEAPDLAARIENRELTSAIELDLAAVRLPRADLSKAYLPGAELSGADLRDANLYALRAAGAKFSHADLRGAKIRHADLRAVVARGADFSFLAGATGGVGVDVCSLSKTTLEGATLDGSSFVGAQLFQTDLRNASLRDVDFSFANLTQTKFGEQPLHRVHLWGADLSLAEGLRPEDLHEVCFNEETRWPPGCPAPTSRWECGADHRGF